jgi:hypothetical protein
MSSEFKTVLYGGFFTAKALTFNTLEFEPTDFWFWPRRLFPVTATWMGYVTEPSTKNPLYSSSGDSAIAGLY